MFLELFTELAKIQTEANAAKCEEVLMETETGTGTETGVETDLGLEQ